MFQENGEDLVRGSAFCITRAQKKGADLWPDPFLYLARPTRFERVTAWFVARYSIQLSYGRVRRRTIGRKLFVVKRLAR